MRTVKEFFSDWSVAECVVGGIILFLCLMGASQAHGMDKRDCRSMASDGITFAERRDDGINKNLAFKAVEEIVAAHMGGPDTYVKDDEDAKRLLKLLLDVWKSPNTPGQVYDLVMKNCQNPTITVLPDGITPKGPQIES